MPLALDTQDGHSANAKKVGRDEEVRDGRYPEWLNSSLGMAGPVFFCAGGGDSISYALQV